MKELRKVLGLKIKTENLQAYNVLSVITEELFQKNKGGDWTYLMLDSSSLKSSPKLPRINQRSWELGFLIKMNRENHVLNSWNVILRSIKNYETFTLEEFEDMYFRAFNKTNWESNLLDVIYFLESRNYVTLKHDIEGHIIEFTVARPDIKEWDNRTVDNYIVFEWGRHYYKNMENQLSQSALRNRVKEAGMEFPRNLPFRA